MQTRTDRISRRLSLRSESDGSSTSSRVKKSPSAKLPDFRTAYLSIALPNDPVLIETIFGKYANKLQQIENVCFCCFVLTNYYTTKQMCKSHANIPANYRIVQIVYDYNKGLYVASRRLLILFLQIVVDDPAKLMYIYQRLPYVPLVFSSNPSCQKCKLLKISSSIFVQANKISCNNNQRGNLKFFSLPEFLTEKIEKEPLLFKLSITMPNTKRDYVLQLNNFESQMKLMWDYVCKVKSSQTSIPAWGTILQDCERDDHECKDDEDLFDRFDIMLNTCWNIKRDVSVTSKCPVGVQNFPVTDKSVSDAAAVRLSRYHVLKRWCSDGDLTNILLSMQHNSRVRRITIKDKLISTWSLILPSFLPCIYPSKNTDSS